MGRQQKPGKNRPVNVTCLALKIEGVGHLFVKLPNGFSFRLEITGRLAWLLWVVVKFKLHDADTPFSLEGWRTRTQISKAIDRERRARPSTAVHPKDQPIASKTINKYFKDLKKELAARWKEKARGATLPDLFESVPNKGIRIRPEIDFELIGPDDDESCSTIPPTSASLSSFLDVVHT